MKYADVIVPLAVEGMYTYAIPDKLEHVVQEGTLVLLAFAGKKKYTALVARIHNNPPKNYQIREIEGVAEEFIYFSAIHLKFLFWVSSYYMACLGEVVKAALPVMFRLESYTSITRTEEEMDELILTPHERMLYHFLRPGEYVSLKEAENYLGLKNGMAVVKKLLDKKYVQVKEVVEELFREKEIQVVVPFREFTEEEYGEILDRLKRAPMQYNMLCCWLQKGVVEWEKKSFLKEMGGNAAILKSLCDKQILKVEKRIWRSENEKSENKQLKPLTEDQKRVLQEIVMHFEQKDCVLLHGVTSSGKTEIYIHLIKQFLEQHKQVLYLLPEIALTIQIVQRLKRAFGEEIGIYHSGMSDQERAALWRKQCSPIPYRLVLGVRSSIFLPFTNLGLIIVDEEHDASYKQKEPAPRYQGRDAAIMLGKMHGARMLLGSATPSFESYQNAMKGKYGLVCLTQRYGGVLLPEIVLVDLKACKHKKSMQGSFSPYLIEEMKRVLKAGKQIILFQNRKGYSSYVQCTTCGIIPKCKYCDVSMTYYKQRNLLVCRYCGATVPVVECQNCGGTYREWIPGTERIEEEVNKLFPNYRVARMDLDIVGSKSRFRRLLQEFEQGEIDVLIGTQMVSKGLDFGNVQLVGILDADNLLHLPDFRAEERGYAMLLQVSGRCGRREEQGKVIIQTSDPENRVYNSLLQGSYSLFFDRLFPERQCFIYPPIGRLIWIEMRGKEVGSLRFAANQLAEQLRSKLGRRICGPAVPEVGRIRDQYRLLIMVKLEEGISGEKIKTFLRAEFATLQEEKSYRSIRIFCDVDP